MRSECQRQVLPSTPVPFQRVVATAGCFALAVCAAGLWSSSRRQGAAAPRGRRLAQRAEGEDGDKAFSVFSLGEEDRAEDEEAKAFEKEMDLGMSLSEESLDDSFTAEGEEVPQGYERQVSYKLYPSRQYVLYIAKKNAERVWSKDGYGGKKSNKGCLEVQIAILTERIRSMVLHVREFKHDFKCRLKLVSLVSRRRRMLDKLSWKDLDSYLKVREELKIRHVYRMEALIGRLPEYRYAIRDRMQAPGRKVSMRLKKTKRLLNRRLADQLRQGKSRKIIHKTRKQITSRKWLARAYDDVESLIADKTPTEFIDPLNVP